MKLVLSLFVILLIATLPSPVRAGPPTLDWVVLSQGGGHASNGTLAMELTIGQPVAGNVANGALQIDYGYWWTILTVNAGVEKDALPVAFAMRPNAPNPFATRTTITFAIPAGPSVPVFIGIYDLRGALVRTLVRESRAPGRYAVTWDGSTDTGDPALAGVYFAKFHAGPFQQTRKLVMLK